MSGRGALVLRQVVLPTVAVLRLALLTAAFLLLAGCIAEATAASTWRVGAAKRDVTPPLFDAAADAALFPTCPPLLFDGPRIFGLQEPYRDLDGSGAFNYSPDAANPEFGQGADAYCDANANGRYDGMYSAGGVDHLLEWVHDPIFARAVAVADDAKTMVIVSIQAIGLFENLTKRSSSSASPTPRSRRSRARFPPACAWPRCCRHPTCRRACRTTSRRRTTIARRRP